MLSSKLQSNAAVSGNNNSETNKNVGAILMHKRAGSNRSLRKEEDSGNLYSKGSGHKTSNIFNNTNNFTSPAQGKGLSTSQSMISLSNGFLSA